MASDNSRRFNGKTSFKGRLNFYHKGPGGGSEYAGTMLVHPTAVTRLADGVQKYCGFRQGALQIQMYRLSGQAFAATWDGNPDEGLKVFAYNYANNLDGVTRIGAVRALNVQARNRGTNISWVKAVEVNACNDSGKNTSELHGLHVRAENYGNVYTDVRGVDIEMSDENTTQAQERIGLIIRNTDGSGMSAVETVFKITHVAASGGFTNLFKFGATTLDTYTGKITDAASLGNTLGYAKVDINGTPGRIPIFGEWA